MKFLTVLLVTAAIVGGLYFADSRGMFRSEKTRVAAMPVPATPAPAATPAPVVVEKVKEPVDETRPVPPTWEQVIQARIEAAQAVAAVRAQAARGEFTEAARALDEWLAGNGLNLQAATVQAQAARLRAAAEAVPAMLKEPAALIGASIPAGNAAWKVTGATASQLKCQVKSQYGMIERPVEVAALPPAALVALLRHADAANRTTLAATYLLGLGNGAAARAVIPAVSPQKEALLASIAESEDLARDYAVIVAFDGVGTLVHRGEFAAAGQRLEQAKKLYGQHDFFSTAYAGKIEDWRKQIASAPLVTPAPVANPAHVAPAPGAKAVAKLPPGPTLPAGAVEGARAALLEGVSSAPRPGQQGALAVYGAAAFPVLTVGEGKGTEIIAAAGLTGKGRALIFGHNGYINSGAQSEGQLGRLMVNAVKWCGGKAKPRIGIKGGDLDKFLDGQGFRAAKFSEPLKKSVLHDYDVVILEVGGLNDPDEAKALAEYLENGGGVIAAMTGWAASRGAFYSTNHANDAFAGAGLAFTPHAIFRDGSAQMENVPMLNAYHAVTAMQKRLGAAPPPTLAQLTARATPAPAAVEVSAADLELGARSISLALEAMPAASKTQFNEVLSSLVSGGRPIVPTKESPLTEGLDTDARLRAGLQARMLKLLPAEAITAHPAAEKFPGLVAKDAKPVNRTIRINPAIPGWQSTGLYADAGAKITVKLPADAVEDGYQVRIGCHSDSLYEKEKWPRIPEITRQTPLNAAETTAASAFGGLVYIVAPGSGKNNSPFDVTISGAFDAPYYVLGETTDAQWREMLKRPAPWAELACRNMIVSIPTSVAHDVKNPAEVMEYWQRTVDAQDDLSDVAKSRRRPERMVPDVLISAGFMHSGYPIMLHLPEAKGMVTVNKEAKPGWGFHHEIGHNHQKGEWTFEGTGEVTNNIFAVYVTEAIDGTARGKNHGGINADNQAKKWGRYLRMNAPYTEWKGDPFLALGTFIRLTDEFGWDSMKKFFRSYDDPNLGPKPKSDEEKRDQWMVRYSKIIGKNLGPYFDACGIPVSSSAKAEISSLPTWMPPGMK